MIFQGMDKIEWCNFVFKLGTVDREWRENIIYDCYEWYFCINGTFEMRTSVQFRIFYSIDNLRMVAKVFISNRDKGGESKEAERPREKVCVHVSIDERQQ